MLRLAVCDDEMNEIHNLMQSLYFVAEEKINVEYYTNCNELLDAVKVGKEFDIYFLDVLMPGMTGINLAHLINEYNRKALIVFITSSKEYALEAFGVKAVRYLMKPVQADELKEAILYCKELLNNREEKEFLIKTPRGQVAIKMPDIIYIESFNRVMYIHKKNGDVVASASLRTSFEETVSDILNTPGFLQVHKSYVVNMNYVDTYTSNSLIMSNEEEVPVSKTKSKIVKSSFLKFIADRNR